MSNHPLQSAPAPTAQARPGGSLSRWARAGAAGLAAVLVAHLLDRWGFRNLLADNPVLLESRDWYRALRVLGFWPVWGVVAAAMMLADSTRRGPDGRSLLFTRGPFLAGSTALAGLLAEGLKLLLRRGRPIDTGGAYVFTPFDQHTFDTSYFGLPSSHAAVAFAAAFACGAMNRRWLWLGLPLAVGCGLTRVLMGQHFVSDVALAGLVGYAAPALIAQSHAALVRRGGGGA